MEHSQVILNIIETRGLTPYKVSKATGIPESVFSQWKKCPSSKIYSKTLDKLADYLECSVDYLMGRTDDPTPH